MSEPALETQARPEGDLSVRSLLIPLDGMNLLVPNALVSEVATLGEIAPWSRGIDWLLGTIDWRGLRVPLVSFERILGESGGNPSRAGRAIVFNTLTGNRALPFVAVVSQRIPRLLLVTGRMLRSIEDARAQEAVRLRAEMHGDEVVIPDVDHLEKMLMQQGVRVERVVD